MPVFWYSFDQTFKVKSRNFPSALWGTLMQDLFESGEHQISHELMICEAAPRVAWTFEEGLLFESARELLTDLISVQTDIIWRELNKTIPNGSLVERSRAERTRLHLIRNSVRIGDSQSAINVLTEFLPIFKETFFRDGHSE